MIPYGCPKSMISFVQNVVNCCCFFRFPKNKERKDGKQEMEKSVKKSLLLLGLYISPPQTPQNEPHFSHHCFRGSRRYPASYTLTYTHSTNTYTQTHTHLKKVLKASWLCPYSGSLEGGVLELTEACPSLRVVCWCRGRQQPGAGLQRRLARVAWLQAARCLLLLTPSGGLGTWV